MTNEPTIHVGATRKYTYSDGSKADVTINLSGIPVHSSDVLIADMMGRAESALSAILGDLENRRGPYIRFDVDAHDVTDPQSEDAPQVEVPDAEFAEMAPEDTPAIEAPVVPSDSEISTRRTVFGIEIEPVNPEWHEEPITREPTSDEATSGQLTAVNAALTEIGMGKDRRHPAALAILAQYGPISDAPARETLTSISDLSKAEAHVVLEWCAKATDQALLDLRMKVTADSLLTQPVLDSDADVEDEDDVEDDESPSADASITLSACQERALNACLDAVKKGENRVIFVTGKAGTGKSTVLRELRNRTRCVVCAPTGLAAINVGGVTIHRMFSLKVGPLTRRMVGSPRPSQTEVLRHAKVVVIDEVSMVRADTFDAIDVSLQKVMRNKLPFGGKTVVLFGDMWQLEPVVGKSEEEFIQKRFRSAMWFDAQVFQPAKQGALDADLDATQIPLDVYELDEVFRQKGDNRFIDALNAVRIGDASGLFVVNERFGKDPDPKCLPVSLTFTNSKAAAINDQRLQALEGEAHTYTASITGDFDEKEIPCPRELALKIGAQVMVRRNIVDEWGGMIANGTIGTVVQLTDAGPTIQIAKTGELATITAAEWKKVDYTFNKDKDDIEEKPVGEFVQVPLTLAWAITVHKSQGQTLDAAILELEMQSRSHGQVYVALSRVKSLEGLFIRRRLTSNDLYVSPRVREFTGVAEPSTETFFDAEAI